MVEMIARLEVLLRGPAMDNNEHCLEFGCLHVNLIEHSVTLHDDAVALLPTEFKLLNYLMRNAGQLVTRTMLFQEVWGYHFDPGTNIIDVHIGRLRKNRTARGTCYPDDSWVGLCPCREKLIAGAPVAVA